MQNYPSLDSASAYLNAHARPNGSSVGSNDGPFVTISREAGTGALAVAKLLAVELGKISKETWTVYDTNLIETMLQSNHLPARLAEFMPEDRVSEINSSLGEIIGLHPNLWTLVQKTNELMRTLARNGHAIFVEHGANFATLGIGRSLHLRFIGNEADRAARTAAERHLTREEALIYNTTKDAGRRRYVRANFGANIADPKSYHMIINTALTPLSEALQIAVKLVSTYLPANT